MSGESLDGAWLLAGILACVLLCAGLHFLYWLNRGPRRRRLVQGLCLCIPYLFGSWLLIDAWSLSSSALNPQGTRGVPKALSVAHLEARELKLPFPARGKLEFSAGATDSADLWTDELAGSRGQPGPGSRLTAASSGKSDLLVTSGRNARDNLYLSAYQLGDKTWIANTYPLQTGGQQAVLELAGRTANASAERTMHWRVKTWKPHTWDGDGTLALEQRSAAGSVDWVACRPVIVRGPVARAPALSTMRIVSLRMAGGHACGLPQDKLASLGQTFFFVNAQGQLQVGLDEGASLLALRAGATDKAIGFEREAKVGLESPRELKVTFLRVRLDSRLFDAIGEMETRELDDRSSLVAVLRHSILWTESKERALLVSLGGRGIAGFATRYRTDQGSFGFSLASRSGTRDEAAYAHGAELLPLPLGGRFMSLVQSNEMSVRPTQGTRYTWFGGEHTSSGLGDGGRWIGDSASGFVRVVTYAAHVPLALALTILCALAFRLFAMSTHRHTGAAIFSLLLILEWLLVMRVLIALQEALIHGGTMVHVYSSLALLWVLPIALQVMANRFASLPQPWSAALLLAATVPASSLLQLSMDATADPSWIVYLKHFSPVLVPWLTLVAVGGGLWCWKRLAPRWMLDRQVLPAMVSGLIVLLHVLMLLAGIREQIPVLGLRVSTVMMPLYVLMFALLVDSFWRPVLQTPWAFFGMGISALIFVAPMVVWYFANDKGAAICFALAATFFFAACSLRGDFELPEAQGHPAGGRWMLLGGCIAIMAQAAIAFAVFAFGGWAEARNADTSLSSGGWWALAWLALLLLLVWWIAVIRFHWKYWLALVPGAVTLGMTALLTFNLSTANDCARQATDETFINCMQQKAAGGSHNALRLQRILSGDAMRRQATSDAISQSVTFDEMAYFTSSFGGAGYLDIHPRRYLDKFDGVPAEHLFQAFGRMGALGVLLLYASVFVVAVASVAHQRLGGFIGLMASAIFFAVPLYVMLSITGLVPFTGRNAYFLTATSMSDWVEGFALITLVLLPVAFGSSSNKDLI